MNKENCHPNLYILKQREAHLSVSRSIPSIFRRRKRARSAQLELSNHQSPTKSATALRPTNRLKLAQSHVRGRTTRPAFHTIYPLERSKLQRIRQSMACKPKCNSRGLPDDHQRNDKLNKEDHSVSSEDLRESENQDDIYPQKLKGCAIKTGEGRLVRVQLKVQRNANGTNDGNRDSQTFEDNSNEKELESDHSGSQQIPVSRGYTASSQCQTLTEK